MAPRKAGKRDYKAEYQRRLSRGKRLGFSVTQSRGHPRKNEAPIKKRKTSHKDVFKEIFGDHQRLYDKINRATRKDARKVFGFIPKRKTGEHPTPFSYEEFLEDKKRRMGNKFDWTDQYSFVDQIMEMGLTEKEAYTLWFSS